MTPSAAPRRFSLHARLTLVATCLAALAVGIALAIDQVFPDSILLTCILTALVVLPVSVLAIRWQIRPMLEMFNALSGTVTSYQDGDYSFGLHWPRHDEMADLVNSHNELGRVLRDQRQHLMQRELLLDAMVQNTPVAMLLIADRGQIVFANLAARQLLFGGRKLEGHVLDEVLAIASSSLVDAIQRGGNALFSVPAKDVADGEDEVFHLARQQFTFNGKSHQLLLLRHLTRELQRQEVQTWKKVIRVISHELNNSLAPITSLANSGQTFLQRGQTERLPEILGTIAERARHLEHFIGSYARFAKLPTPQPEKVEWTTFLAALQSQMPFRFENDLPVAAARFDRAQMEQALLNLLKNAHESGSSPDQINLCVRQITGAQVIEVSDSGPGMSETVMAQALVPFYSTKRSGTGLGLALAREIIEAHNGHITLRNRQDGGLVVSLVLPIADQ